MSLPECFKLLIPTSLVGMEMKKAALYTKLVKLASNMAALVLVL